jgi:two-component system sensor histidine kinase KdpD
MDELAHANLPGERHQKRWQDVDDLLASGIDVYTTLNIANVETLGRTVSEITGAPPAEPVPDEFVRAGEIRLVDLAPAVLRRRLAQGLIVPEEQVDAALSSYFRFANLAALRELAQFWLDDSVPDPVAAFAIAHGISESAQASVIVVGLAGSPADEWLIRYAAHLAELCDAARQPGYAQLVIGAQRRSRWRLLNGSTVADQVLRDAGDLPVQVVNVGRPDKDKDEDKASRATREA